MSIQIHANERLIKIFFGLHGQKWVWPLWSQNSKFDSISRRSRWNVLIFLHADTYSGNLRVALIVFCWTLAKIVMTFYLMTLYLS